MSIETVGADEVDVADLLGSAVERREDPALLTGDAEYTDDIQHPRGVHLALERSQHAHARIEGIDASAAEDRDGVLAVYTAEDLHAAGIEGTLPTSTAEFATVPEWPMLASGKVRYQGEPVAAVVAEDRYAAHDALDDIDVEYDRLGAVVGAKEAIEDGAPEVHDDVPGNVSFEWENGDEAAVEDAFDDADRIVEFGFDNGRVQPTAMEPRTAVARYEGSTGRLEVEVSTQKPHTVQANLSSTLGVPDNKVRVRAPAVGGGFGAKLRPYAGHHLAAWAATRIERPVKWTATRSEDLLSTIHARELSADAEAAVSEDGRILGVRVKAYSNLGSYLLGAGAKVSTGNFGHMFTGQYAIPAAHVTSVGVFTNTTPLSSYRGPGRAEACYLIERLVHTVAKELGEDPAEIRRRNFVPAEEFPYETPLGHVYDSGDYGKTLEEALEAVDYGAFRERQREAREDGRYLGIGLSCYVEACGVGPGSPESGLVRVKPSGSVVVQCGTAEIGTGHATPYAQIAANALGVDYGDVEVVEGDTAEVPEGNGTAGSRAIPVGGSAIRESATKVVEKARRIAAHQLEADAEDVEFGDGEFHVAGAPGRSVHIKEVADAAYGSDVPDGMEPGLEATSYFDPPDYTFPFGTHAAVVEVDPETGEIGIERYVAVDDVGEQINPKIVEGQIHGGVAQGVGQALYEGAEHDENGNLLTASLMDYAFPKAFHVPEMETGSTVTASPHNPLGAKGVGEAGSIGAPPAVVNAVVDALEPFGVDHLDMPVTPEKAWRAMRDGG